MNAPPLGSLVAAYERPRASDAIFGLVSGLPRDERGRQPLAMLQAHVDDSGRGNPPVFVLAGLVANAAAWAEFSDEWEETLKSDPPLEFLKMKKFMKMDPWRESSELKLSKLYALQEVINKYVEYGVVAAVSTWDYEEVFAGIGPKEWKSEYHYMVGDISRRILLHEYRIGRQQSVDFIFDKQMNQEDAVHLAWSRAQSGPIAAKIRRRMGSVTYGCDTKIRPLQAADMVAWLYRKVAADLLGDAGNIFPSHKGRPLYDPSILSMGMPQKMFSPEGREERSAGDVEALMLRTSSKSWPGSKMLRIPIEAFYVSKDELIRARDYGIRNKSLIREEPPSKQKKRIK